MSLPPAESDGQQTRLIRVAVAYGLTHPGGAIERILRGCGILDDPAILSGVGEISTYDFSDYDRFAEYDSGNYDFDACSPEEDVDSEG